MERVMNYGGGWEKLAKTAAYDPNKVAALFGVSLRQVEREFRQEFDRSPREWLTEQRIVAASRMLLEGRSVKSVAFELGYKQVSHFCRQFKFQKGMTPSQFKRVECECG